MNFEIQSKTVQEFVKISKINVPFHRTFTVLCYIFLIVFSLFDDGMGLSCCVQCRLKIQKAIDCILIAVLTLAIPKRTKISVRKKEKYFRLLNMHLLLPFWNSVFPFLCVAQKCVNAFTVRIVFQFSLDVKVLSLESNSKWVDSISEHSFNLSCAYSTVLRNTKFHFISKIWSINTRIFQTCLMPNISFS